eukprot:m.16245 g.16245  ORF g.16245 m.16245 type:complete len:306 (-) comp5633_c0_seq1:21-938(-)
MDDMHNSSKFHGGLFTCQEEEEYVHACVRAASSTFLGVATVIACIVKLCRLWSAFQVQSSKPIVVALALCEALLLTLKWSLGLMVWAHFVAIYLGVLQFLIICLFYGGLVLRMADKRNLLFWVFYPAAALGGLWFSGVLGWSVMAEKDNGQECRQVHWILFSSSQVVLLGFLILAAFYLSRALASLPRSQATKAKLRTLWMMIMGFAFSAVTHFTFDLIYITASVETENCDMVFGSYKSIGFNFYEMLQHFTLLTPIWIILLVWKVGPPKPVDNVTESEHLHVFTSDGSSDEDDELFDLSQRGMY